MMAKRVKAKVSIPTEELNAVIQKSGKRPIKIEAWRYYSIVDVLRCYGIDRQEAHDLAKWCCRSHEVVSKTIGDVTIELKKVRKKNDNTQSV